MQTLPDFDLILFGGTGDLAMRKLLPALFRRRACGQMSPASRIIGAARSKLTREQYLEQVRERCKAHVGEDLDAQQWEAFAAQLDYLPSIAGNTEDFQALAGRLADCESRVRVFFLSTGPELFAPIAEGLS